jgi:hypothetical protein
MAGGPALDPMPNPIPFFAKTRWTDAEHYPCAHMSTCPYGHGNLARPRSGSPIFGILPEDRRLHAWLVGKTGMGKSTLLKNLATWDLREGRGLAVLDPNGDLVEDLLQLIPRHRTHEVIYFDPSDLDWPMGLNILTAVDRDHRHVVADWVVSVFKHFWEDSWGPRLEHSLRHSILTLLEVKGSTLLGIPRLLTDKPFRAWVVSQLTDPHLKRFWTEEYERAHAALRAESTAPILNKVGAFLAAAPLRRILGQPRSKIDFSWVMDHGRIFLANLSKGKIGEQNSALLGSLPVTKFFLAALGRQWTPEAHRRDFHLTIDEVHNLSNTILAPMLSESRKYHLCLTLANQYVDQLKPEIKSALLGNVGTLMAFRLGSTDAYDLAREFAPTFGLADMEHLGCHEMALKLAINGLTSQPFRATTLSPFMPAAHEANRGSILKSSHEKYAARRTVVEEQINRWLASSQPIRHTKEPHAADGGTLSLWA